MEDYHLKPFPTSILEARNQDDLLVGTNSSIEALKYLMENSKDDVLSGNAEGFKFSGSFVGFQNFSINVNGFTLDSKLSENCLIKYYELCCAQNSYLHTCLLKSINSTLASGIISETVNIADAVKSCKICASRDDFALWDKTLAGFELLGMEVQFLCARINKLARLAIQSGETPESKRYTKAWLEHNLAEEDIRTVETKLLELQQVRMNLCFEMDDLKMSIHSYESGFVQEANCSMVTEKAHLLSVCGGYLDFWT